MEAAQEFVDFVNASPSPFNVVAYWVQRLTAVGFTHLLESQPWGKLVHGKYFLTRNQTTIIAFTIG